MSQTNRNILNASDGSFRIDDNFCITPMTKWEDIVNYFDQYRVKIYDYGEFIGNINVHSTIRFKGYGNSNAGNINARNVEIDGYWFIFTFSFLRSMLQEISFVVDDKEFDPLPSWESWSEEKEMQHLKFGENWLYQQTGTMERFFHWGVIYAYYDSKVGGTHIGLKYG